MVDVKRHLPASEAAPDLARPTIDLALGRRIPRSVVKDLSSLAAALLAPAVSSPDVRTVDLCITCEPPSIRLEVRWISRGPSARDTPEPDVREPLRDQWAGIQLLAHRWGYSRRDRHRCVWAERFTDPDPRTWPAPPDVSAA